MASLTTHEPLSLRSTPTPDRLPQSPSRGNALNGNPRSIAIVGALFVGIQWLTQAPFRKVAREFNLSGDFPTLGPPQELTGEIGHYPVQIRTLGEKESISKDLEIRLRLSHPLADSMFVKTALFLERFTQDDLEVQDPTFDRKFILEGADLELLAYLNSDRRALLSKWKRGLIAIDEGDLIHQSPLSALSNHRLRGTLIQMRDMATSLDQNEMGLYEALTENAYSDPNPRFRRRCIKALLREAKPNKLTLEFARAHLEESDLEVRAWAAEALGEEGIPTLLSIVTKAEADEAAALFALRALASHKHEDAEKGVFHALAMTLDAIRADVIKALIEKQRISVGLHGPRLGGAINFREDCSNSAKRGTRYQHPPMSWSDS